MLNEKLLETKNFLKKISSTSPETAIVLGSGLSKICDSIEDSITVSYKDIPHLHSTTVQGHCGELIFGKLEKKDVLILSGRIHAYEGHDTNEVVFPIRALSQIGVKNLIDWYKKNY